MENMLHGSISSRQTKGDTNKLRLKGRIPGIIYGLKDTNMLVEFGELELNRIINTKGEYGRLNVDILGDNLDVIIKEVQRDPVTERINHIDLQRIDKNKRVQTRIPIIVTGEEHFKNADVILQQQLNEVHVIGMPDNLPKYIKIDVSKISKKKKLKVSDIEVSEEISILNNPEMTVVSLNNVKRAKEVVQDEIYQE